MKGKVLFVANHKGFSKFNAPYMQWFRDQGWQVDNASPGIMVDCIDNQYDIPIQRSPLSLKNIRAYRELKKLIEENDYDIVHVHTPMGAFIGRLAARKMRKSGKTKVIYTAHGYHFYKGASLAHWMLFYPIERMMAGSMDALVTINAEDYERAQQTPLCRTDIYRIDGVGVNLSRFSAPTDVQRNECRARLGLRPDDFVMLFIGQFTKDKNQRFIIDCLPQLKQRIPSLQAVFVGGGGQEEACKHMAQSLGAGSYSHFLGFRQDVPDICKAADVHVSSSVREGQGINNIEAMASGCPLVVSDIRGHHDVCIDGRNGFLFQPGDSGQFIESVVRLANDTRLRQTISQTNLQDAHKFSIEREVGVMAEIYRKYMN